jgi:hypothetical protein
MYVQKTTHETEFFFDTRQLCLLKHASHTPEKSIVKRPQSAEQIEERKRQIRTSLLHRLVAQDEPIVTHSMRALLLADDAALTLARLVSRAPSHIDNNNNNNNNNDNDTVVVNGDDTNVDANEAARRSLGVVRIFSDASTTIRDVIHLKTGALLTGLVFVRERFLFAGSLL